MKTKDIMTANCVYCVPDTSITEVSRLMLAGDCGLVPVVDSEENMKPVGVVTDRDIVCRLVADGKNPLTHTAEECMSKHVVVVTPETTIEECCKKMEHEQVRRVVVIDGHRALCGVLSQADIALHASSNQVGHLLAKISARNTKGRHGKREIHQAPPLM